MTTVIREIYEALNEADAASEEKATAAAAVYSLSYDHLQGLADTRVVLVHGPRQSRFIAPRLSRPSRSYGGK